MQQISVRRPPVRNERIYRGLFEVGPPASEAFDIVDGVFDVVIAWVNALSLDHVGVPMKKLRGRDQDERTFEARVGDAFGFTVAQDVAGGRYAVRVAVQDPEIEHRRWITNACAFVIDDVPAFEVDLLCHSIAVPGSPVRRVPDIVERIGARYQLRDTRPMDGTVWEVMNPDNVETLVDFICTSSRRFPIVVVSEPSLLDVSALAQSLKAVAHVVSLGAYASSSFTESIGKPWSVYGGAVRTYRPGLDLSGDPYRHPLVLQSVMLNYRDDAGVGRDAFVRSFIDRTYRNTISGLEGLPLHDVLWVRRVIVDRQHEAPIATPQRPSTLPLNGEAATLVDGQAVGGVEQGEEVQTDASSAQVAEQKESEEIRLLREELAAAREGKDEAELRASEAEARFHKLDDESYDLLSQLESATEENKRLKAGQSTGFNFAVDVDLPGAKELVLSVGGLVRGIHAILADVSQVQRALTEETRRRFALEARVRAFERSQEGAELDLGAPVVFPGYDDPDGFGQFVRERYAGRLVLHPRAIATWKDGEYEDVAHVFQALDLLANEFRTMRLRDHDDDQAQRRYRDRLNDFDLRDSPTIADSQFGRYRNDYEVEWNGKPVKLDRHLRSPRSGNTADPKRVMAIYYFWDSEAEMVVVGSLPGHLRNRVSP